MASKRRITVDLNEVAAAEIERLRKLTGLSTADLFRHSITLLRIYVQAKQDEREIRIVDPKDTQDQARLEMPITVMPALKPLLPVTVEG